jgi:hypothetical protein
MSSLWRKKCASDATDRIPLCANPLFFDASSIYLSLLDRYHPYHDLISFQPVLAPYISPASPASPYSFEPKQATKVSIPSSLCFPLLLFKPLFCTTNQISRTTEMPKTSISSIPFPKCQLGRVDEQKERAGDILDMMERDTCGRGKRRLSCQLLVPCLFPGIAFSAVCFFVVVAVSHSSSCIPLARNVYASLRFVSL